MTDADSDISRDHGGGDDSTESASLSTEALLCEYEQSRITIRRYIIQQGRVFTSGIAALAAISGYSVTVSGEGYFSPIITTIPFVVSIMSVLSIEAANNNIVMRKHNQQVGARLREITGESKFGVHSNIKEFRISSGAGLDWYNVPFWLLWLTIFTYYIIHVIAVPMSTVSWVPINPILESQFLIEVLLVGYAAALGVMCTALYSHIKLRQDDS